MVIQNVAFYRLGTQALQVGGVGEDLRDDRSASFGVPGQLDLDDHQPAGRFDSYEVGVTVAQQHLLTNHYEPWVSSQGQYAGRLFYQVMEGLLVRKASRSQQAPTCSVVLP